LADLWRARLEALRYRCARVCPPSAMRGGYFGLRLRCGIVHVTIYRGAKAPEPLAQDDLPWPELCDEIEAMAEIEYDDKLAMLAIGPHRLTTPYRNLANVAEVTLLVIDVDRCDPEAVAERLREIEIDALMYASPSDDPDGPADARRVRVLAPVSRPMTKEECGRARFTFAEALGLGPGQGVEGAPDASRLFFVGRLAGTAPRQIWRFNA
jgi:hypothetical protein